MSIFDTLGSYRFNDFSFDKNVLTLRSGGCINNTSMYIKREHIDSVVVIKKLNFFELIIAVVMISVGVYLDIRPTEYILIGVGGILIFHAIVSYFIQPIVVRTNNGIFLSIGCGAQHDVLINWFCRDEAELYRGSQGNINTNTSNNNNNYNNNIYSAPLLNTTYNV